MISGVRSVAGVAVALSLCACSQTQEPAASKPPVTPEHVAVQPPPQSTGQIETAVVDFKPIQPELVRAAVLAARDEEDLRARLAALVSQADPRFAATLERASYAAAVLGYVAADERRA